MESSLEGAVCIPNISGPGRRRRQRFALVMGGVALVGLGASIALGYGPLPRALLGLPVAAALASYLQVRRSTCVAHAYGGTIEHDDFSTTKAPTDQNTASRKVAATILRDATLGGAVAAALAVATTYVI